MSLRERLRGACTAAVLVTMRHRPGDTSYTRKVERKQEYECALGSFRFALFPSTNAGSATV